MSGFYRYGKITLKKKFELGDTVKVEDAAWELGVRDTFSLLNKQCFVMGFSTNIGSNNVYLNFVNPNIFGQKKSVPRGIPITEEFIYSSRILLIENV